MVSLSYDLQCRGSHAMRQLFKIQLCRRLCCQSGLNHLMREGGHRRNAMDREAGRDSRTLKERWRVLEGDATVPRAMVMAALKALPGSIQQQRACRHYLRAACRAILK